MKEEAIEQISLLSNGTPRINHRALLTMADDARREVELEKEVAKAGGFVKFALNNCVADGGNLDFEINWSDGGLCQGHTTDYNYGGAEVDCHFYYEVFRNIETKRYYIAVLWDGSEVYELYSFDDYNEFWFYFEEPSLFLEVPNIDTPVEIRWLLGTGSVYPQYMWNENDYSEWDVFVEQHQKGATKLSAEIKIRKDRW